VTALPGLKVGHAGDERLKSGVTAFLPDEAAVAAVHVAGAAQASRETDLLDPGNTVERVNAIVLSGGSAFGLAAADGAMAWLTERKRGYRVGEAVVPIVPAAALFDLNNGGDKSTFAAGAAAPLYRELARHACDAAAGEPAIGTFGSGTGAATADLKGGFGAASAKLGNGGTVVAYVAVNAVGSVTLGDTPYFRAAPFEIGKEFGGLGLPSPLPGDAAAIRIKQRSRPGENTTLAVIATDLALTRVSAKRLAVAAHDGIALAIFPAHTPLDGDTVFALSTGRRTFDAAPSEMTELCAAATTALARAIARAVFSAGATPNDRVPAWRERHGGGTAKHAG
jgi:L-aminopeptidase/D-esterase-like protein